MAAHILVTATLYYLLLVYTAMAGETCVFSDGDASVSVFCDDGCCDSQCCGDAEIDEVAIAIAIATVIGIFLLIIFVVLLIYCYHHRRNKPSDEEHTRKISARNNVHPARPRYRNNFSQTGDQEYPNKKDRTVDGDASRWTSYNPFPEPRLEQPGRPRRDRQTQTGNARPTRVSEMSSSVFASNRALRGNWQQRPEPPVTVPAPFWRYHKKATTESKDVYSLLEKKAREAKWNHGKREEEHEAEQETGMERYEDESENELSSRSQNDLSSSD